ncbi:MAG: flippase-like domain-containing protein [Nitrospiraceae bacterium]|nr:MAG: flippase-like domain-containing protein [Nitrospiraceae bacterium]
MNRKHLHLTVGLIIIVLSLFFAFRGVDMAALAHALVSVRFAYLVPAVLMVIVSYLFRAMRWRYLVRSVKDVTTGALLSPLMVGFMANMLPARAGEFIRAYLLSRKEKISFSASFATIFIERLFDLLLVLLMLVAVLLFMPQAFVRGDAAEGGRMLEMVTAFGAVSLALCVFICLLAVLLQFRHDWTMNTLGVLLRPLPGTWGRKLSGMVISFSEGLSIIRDRRGFFAVVLLSVVIWATFVFTYYPLYFAFGIQASLPVPSSLVVLCLVVAIFITVAPTPGFLGSYHLGCVAALHGIFGIQKATALSYGIVAWLVAMGTTVIIGALFAVKENISFGEISSATEKKG